MADILLTTINARYVHAAFSLRCLMAALGPLRERAEMVEYDLKRLPEDIATDLLARDPKVVLFSVYIWNVTAVTRVLQLLRERAPGVRLVIGGPEVTYAPPGDACLRAADCLVRGEGEPVVEEICRRALAGEALPVEYAPPPPAPADLPLPYAWYSDEDVRNRIIYIETARGCPYRCAYCLSSMEIKLRLFDPARLYPEFERLIDRGVKLFKFLDRSFNAHPRRAVEILTFFLERLRPGMCLHMELVPDRMPELLRECILKFPPGVLHFEVGVQSCNAGVLERIQRRQDPEKTAENLAWLCAESGAVVHADLIFGLPGESMESMAAGFDRLVPLAPDRLEVNALKLLRGTPLEKLVDAHGLVFDPEPPYCLLESPLVSREQMERLQRFDRFWEIFYNSGHFTRSLPLLWEGEGKSPFACFTSLAEWMYQRHGRAHGLHLRDLVEDFFAFATGPGGVSAEQLAPKLAEDYQADGKRHLPKFLKRVDLRPTSR